MSSEDEGMDLVNDEIHKAMVKNNKYAPTSPSDGTENMHPISPIR